MFSDKAKPSVRVGRKATGLAGGTFRLPRLSMMLPLDSRVAEVSSRLYGYFVESRLENSDFLLAGIVCRGSQEVSILSPQGFHILGALLF